MSKMPASNANFKEYAFNIDISKFTDDDLEEEKYTKSYNMLSLGQLKDTIPTMKISYDEYLTSKSNSIYVKVYANELYQQNDSVDTKQFTPIILDNYDLRGKIDVLNAAINNVKTTAKNIIPFFLVFTVKILNCHVISDCHQYENIIKVLNRQ